MKMENHKVSALTEKINKTLSQPQFPKVQNIEFELLMQHVRELYDELDAIRNAKNEPVKRKHENRAGESLQPEELLIRRTIHTNEHFLLNDIHAKQEEPELKKTEQKLPEQKVPVKRDLQTPASSKASLNESITFPGSLNEKLKSSSASEMHKVIASKNLKDMIDLNKKFVLVNELFSGNKEHFTIAVSYIDECNNYAAAEAFIRTQLIAANNWNQQSPAAQLFMNLVKSKFGQEE
jgi:hypothetical protein